jgi:EmrB/QacA subfamily drug resistance transporter
MLPSVEPLPQLSDRRRTLILVAMCTALVMVISGVSMLNNALPRLAELYGLSQSKQQWVIDAFTVVLAASLLPAGAFGDRFGRRKALLGGSVIFGLGSVIAALAHSANLIIAARGLTGLGAALVMPGTLSTITSVFPAEKRAKAIGVWVGFAVTGGTIGMLASGLLVDHFYPGSVFVVSAIAAAIVVAALLAWVPDTRSSERVHLDPGGAVLSFFAFAGLVVGIIEGPERGWSAPITLGALALGVVLLVAFVTWELRQEAPLLDPRLFRLHGFATGSASIFLQFVAMFGFFYLGVQYLQLVLGYGALKAALATLPMTGVMMVGTPATAPLVARLGQRVMATMGLVVTAAGFGIFLTVGNGTGYWLFLISSVVIAFGAALAMTPATNAIVSSLPPARQGVASAVNDAARELGSAFGVALIGSALNIGYRRSIDPHLGGLTKSVADQAHEAPATALQAADKLGAAGDALAQQARNAFVSGLRYAFVAALVAVLIGALYTWLRSPNASEAVLEDALDEPGLAGALRAPGSGDGATDADTGSADDHDGVPVPASLSAGT